MILFYMHFFIHFILCLCKPPNIFLFSTTFEQNRRFLLFLITPVICTRDLIRLICTRDLILWFLKINIPLHKHSLPVCLFPADVLNHQCVFNWYFILWKSLIYQTPFIIFGWFFEAILDFNAQLYLTKAYWAHVRREKKNIFRELRVTSAN